MSKIPIDIDEAFEKEVKSSVVVSRGVLTKKKLLKAKKMLNEAAIPFSQWLKICINPKTTELFKRKSCKL